MRVYSVVSVVTHLQNDPSVSLFACICGKRNLAKVLEPPTKSNVLLQLLLKATEHLKPLGNFESCTGKRCLQSNLVHFRAMYPIFLRAWGTEQRKKQYIWLSFSVLIQPLIFLPVDRIGFEAVVVRTSLFLFCASRLWLSDLKIKAQQSVCALLCFLTRLFRKPSALSESFSCLHSSEGSSEHKNRKWG